MRTYSRRTSSQPWGRSGASDSADTLTTSTPSEKLDPNDGHTKSPSSSTRSSSSKSGVVPAPAGSATTAKWQASLQQPAPTPPLHSSEAAAAAAVSLERKRRRLALATVPVCPLSSTPAPSFSTPSASVGAFGVERRPGSSGSGGVMTVRGAGGGSEDGGRSVVVSQSDSRSVFGVRTLWGAGDQLSAGRKRRRPGAVKSAPAAPSTRRHQQQQQQLQQGGGSSLKKRPAGKGGETGGMVWPARGKNEQMFLDFGQKSLGHRILCPRCNVLYVCGSADDEAQHASICAKASRGVDFSGWKQERVKARFEDDGARVVEIREGDPAAHLAKLREVERLMDADMGFVPGGREETISQPDEKNSRRGGEGGSVWGSGRGGGTGNRGREEVLRLPGSAAKKKAAVTAFLYVRGKRVLGCVVAERIQSARRAVVVVAAAAAAPGEDEKPATPPQTPSKKAIPAPNVSGVGFSSAALSGGIPRFGTVEVPVLAAVRPPSDVERCVAGNATAAAVGSGPHGRSQHEGDRRVPFAPAIHEQRRVSQGSGKDEARGRTGDDNDDWDIASAGTPAAATEPATSLLPSVGPPLSPSQAVNEAPPPPRVRGVDKSRGRGADCLGIAADELQPPPGSVGGFGVAGTSTAGAGRPTITKTTRAGGVGGAYGGEPPVPDTAAPSSSPPSARALSKREPRSRGGTRLRRSSKKLSDAAKRATPSLERFWLPQRGQQPSGALSAAAGGAVSTEAKSSVDEGDGRKLEGNTWEGTALDSCRRTGQGGQKGIVGIGGGGAGDRPRDEGGDLRGLRAWTAGEAAAAACSRPVAAAGARAACSGSPFRTEGATRGAGGDQEEMAMSTGTQQRAAGDSRGGGRGSSPPGSWARREETRAEKRTGRGENRSSASFFRSQEKGARASAGPARAAAGAKTMRVRASPWSVVPAEAPVAAATRPEGAASAPASPFIDHGAAPSTAVTGRTAATSPAPTGTASLARGGARFGERGGDGPGTRLENLPKQSLPSGFRAHGGGGGGGGGGEAGCFRSNESEEDAEEAACRIRRPADVDGEGSAESKDATAAGAGGSSGSEDLGDGGGDGGGGGGPCFVDTGGVGGVDCDVSGVGDIGGRDGSIDVCGGDVSGVDVPGVGSDGRLSSASKSGHLTVSENAVSAAEKRHNRSSRPLLPLRPEGDGRQQQQQQRQRPGSPAWSMDSASFADSEDVSSPAEKNGLEEEAPTPLPLTVLTGEEEETQAVVGILQVWVHEQSRRQGVATRLVDTVREKMVYGLPLRREQVAFSQPTREGQAFAIRYTGGESKLLVY